MQTVPGEEPTKSYHLHIAEESEALQQIRAGNKCELDCFRQIQRVNSDCGMSWQIVMMALAKCDLDELARTPKMHPSDFKLILDAQTKGSETL